MDNFQIIVTCQRCGHKEFIDNPQRYSLIDNAFAAGFKLRGYNVQGAKADVRICGTCNERYEELLSLQADARIAFFEESD